MFNQHLAFSKYRLLARLGSGGMADVFLAVSGHGAGGFNKLLVLKVLRPDLPATERADFFRMFQDEGRLAMRLSHPAIVQAYEVGSDDAVSFIAMEYLEGQPLSAIQERGWMAAPGISPALQIHVLCQVLDGLEYAHTLTDYSGRKLNIVHRDVSPQNVFVTYSGHTKLVDFGIAKTLESNSKTAAGVVKGKVPYMSPEQVRCGAVDHRADLFSVGVMLWEAVAGRSMHGNASLYEILQRLVAGDLPRLRDAVPDVDPELDRIATRAMSRDPEQRHPDAAALRDELVSFLERSGKVTSRELGERVAKLFEPERQAINEVIRKAMSDAADESFDTRPDHAVQLSRLSLVPQAPETGRITQPTVPPSRELAADNPRSAADDPRRSAPVPSGPPVVVPLAVAPSNAPRATEPVTDSAAALSPTAEVRAPKRWSRGAVLGAGGTALLLVAVGLTSASRGLLTPGSTSLEAAAPAVVSQPLEARDKVRLSLQAHPSNAVFVLDGQVLEGNPHRGERARDSRPHTLSVSADGHEPREIEIELTRDVDLEVRLAEAAPPAPAAQALPSAAAVEPATASGRRRARRASGAGRANDEDLYPDLPAPRAAQNSAQPAPPAAAASDDDLYPDLPAKKPRGAPKLDTSESPW